VVRFLHGAASMGCVVASLFFLRFWRRSLDRLFALFSVAFAVLAADYAILGLTTIADEWRPYVYALRLLGFALIAAAIVDKNVRRR
jgi:hypothetical protein